MAFFGLLLILIGLLDPILINIFKIDLCFFVELPPIISQLTPVIAVAAGSLLTWLDSKKSGGDQTQNHNSAGASPVPPAEEKEPICCLPAKG